MYCAKHRLGLPSLQPCQFWGTNLKGSNPISGTSSNLVSWGLQSSRAPTLSSKAPTLSLWGSNLLGSNPQLHFLKICLVILHGSQCLLQRALSHLVSTLHHQWPPFLLRRCHHCSSSYPTQFSKSPHDDIKNASWSPIISPSPTSISLPNIFKYPSRCL